MFIPAAVSGLAKESDTALSIAGMFNDPFGLVYNIVFALLIVIFTYFYTAITVPTNKMADDLKEVEVSFQVLNQVLKLEIT